MSATPVGTATTAFVNAATDVVLNVPAGVSDGEKLITALVQGSGQTWTPPTGWNLIDELNSGGVALKMSVYERTASSEPASYTWVNSAATRQSAICFRVTGWDTGTLVDVKLFQANTTPANTLDHAGVTTTVADTLLLMVSSGRTDVNETWTVTPDAAMAEISGADVCSTVGGGNPNRLIEVAWEARASAGATGARAATFDASEIGPSITALIAIRSATGGGGGGPIPVILHHLRQQGIA